jgi:hypothetical protein
MMRVREKDHRRHLFTAGEGAAFEELYLGISETSFAQQVLSVQSDRLVVVRAVGLGWSDLGEPGRVRSVLQRMIVRTQLRVQANGRSAAAH